MQYFNGAKSGIYRINLSNENFYIGSSVNFRARNTEHLNELKRKDHTNSRMQNCWNKYGVYEFIVLEECDAENLLTKEQAWIDKHFNDKGCVNIVPNAGRTTGYKHTQVSLEKISESSKGRRHSEETRKKMSEIGKERTFSETHRRNLAEAGKRRAPATDEARAKMSESAKKSPKNTNRSPEANKNRSDAQRKRWEKHKNDMAVL